MSLSPKRSIDIVVWGGTGFTGKLVCSYLHTTYPTLRIAVAGRNQEKLLALQKELQLSENFSVVVANLDDPKSLDDIISKAKVVLTTAGPYAQIGTPIVEACIRSGTHYCDITGETPWIKSLIEKYHDAAVEKSVRIVNCCGFDCVPSDLGAQMIRDEMVMNGITPSEIRMVLHEALGGVSGGTIASGLNMIEAPLKELAALQNPYLLNPRDKSNKIIQSSNKKQLSAAQFPMTMGWDSVEKCWVIPYVMQAVDTPIVHRSLALSGLQDSLSIAYSERMRVPNIFAALMASLIMPIVGASFFFSLTRNIIKRFLPKPGEGPPAEVRDKGFFIMKFWGKGKTLSNEEVLVRGGVTEMNGDPGYKCTSKMVAEAAVCLALDEDVLPKSFGIITPSIAMGPALRKRLEATGMQFFISK